MMKKKVNISQPHSYKECLYSVSYLIIEFLLFDYYYVIFVLVKVQRISKLHFKLFLFPGKFIILFMTSYVHYGALNAVSVTFQQQKPQFISLKVSKVCLFQIFIDFSSFIFFLVKTIIITLIFSSSSECQHLQRQGLPSLRPAAMRRFSSHQSLWGRVIQVILRKIIKMSCKHFLFSLALSLSKSEIENIFGSLILVDESYSASADCQLYMYAKLSFSTFLLFLTTTQCIVGKDARDIFKRC